MLRQHSTSGLDQPVAIGIPLTEGVDLVGFGHYGPRGLRSFFGGHVAGGDRGDGGDGGVVFFFFVDDGGGASWMLRSQNGTETERVGGVERRGDGGKEG